jgi:hypothetical protein
MLHSINTNHVEVAIEHQRRFAAWAKTRDYVRPIRNYFLQLDLETPLIENCSERLRASPLARRTRHESRISRIDFDQGAGERDRIATRYDHDLPSFRFA